MSLIGELRKVKELILQQNNILLFLNDCKGLEIDTIDEAITLFENERQDLLCQKIEIEAEIRMEASDVKPYFGDDYE